MGRGFAYGLFWSLLVGAIAMLLWFVALLLPATQAFLAKQDLLTTLAERWSAITIATKMSLYVSMWTPLRLIVVVPLCFFVFGAARNALPNRNAWWGAVGGLLGLFTGLFVILLVIVVPRLLITSGLLL